MTAAGTGCFRLHRKAPPPAEPALPPEIAESISPFKNFDHRPYEFIWSDRTEEEEPPLVDFEGLLGWTVETGGGVEAELSRTQERQLWGEYVGKLVCRGAAGAGRVVLRPPEPIPIRDRFDCINIWVFGNYTEGEPASLSVRVDGADGKVVSIALGPVDWLGWSLAHRRVRPDVLARLLHPCRLRAIVLEPVAADPESVFYLDSLSFYTERLPPLTFAPRPRRNVSLLPGQSVGLHTGPDRLPFPVSEETIRPPAPAAAFTNSILREAEGVYLFRYEGADERFAYRFRAGEGLGGIELVWDGRTLGRLMEGAGIEGLVNASNAPAVLREEDDSLRVEYVNKAAYVLRIRGKTLVMDAFCRGGAATGLTLGRPAGFMNARVLNIPFLAMPPDEPPGVLCVPLPGEGGPRALYAGVWVDWYRSGGSELYTGRAGRMGAFRLNGGVRYEPTTGGRRNDLFERVILSSSTLLGEVLPTVANPRGAHAGAAADRLWVEAEQEEGFGVEHKACRRLRRHGASRLIQCSGRDVWQDAGESFSLRSRAAPHRGGDTQLERYVEEHKALGWRKGLYANYTEIDPLSRYWSSDAVERMPDAEWRRGEPGRYILKPARALEWQGEISPRVRERFHGNTSYVDEIGAHPPWAYTDYDARVPGAGSFAQTYYCQGELLRTESEIYEGPVVVSGGYAWMYAGLSDAHVGSAAGSLVRAGRPYLPLFALTRLNPLECGYGLGSLDEFFSGEGDWRQAPSDGVDQYLAAELAYGRAGRLVGREADMNLVYRSYYLLQQVQERCALQAPVKIAYWDGAQYLSTSAAVAGGAYERSQVYVHFPADLEMWVNGSPSETWRMRVGRDTWTLPPHGWVVAGPGLLEVSALVEGTRLDYVDAPAYRYYDGRGREEPFRGMASPAPLVLEKGAGGPAHQRTVLNLGGAGRFGWEPAEGLGRPVRCSAYDEDDQPLGEAGIEMKNGLVWITSVAEGLRYVIEFAPGEGAAAEPLMDTRP